ncbi:MAG: adenylate/guanylate cyclase domain-containing protein [Planctomycetes bacterium]|nr:adenylate/guanylate cyclase domain-containing protein [Planctomycetota bacterium]
MKRTTLFGLLLGLAVTAAVTGIDVLGGFTRWERLSVDYRFTGAFRPAEPMTDQIVHVDIDDMSLDLIGWWPWPRTRIADAVDELQAAGAKTIALDIMWSEPSVDPAEDRHFAAALSRLQSVLAVDIDAGTYDPLWLTETGRAELERLLDVLGENIRLEEREALDEAQVTGQRRTLFRGRPWRYKNAAAWKVLRTADPPFSSFQAFERAIAPDLTEITRSYAEQDLLRSTWRQDEAWRIVRDHLQPTDHLGDYCDRPPISALAEAASGVGSVTVTKHVHGDGAVREVPMDEDAPGGTALQFGLAAAMVHGDIEPVDVTFESDRITVGDEVTLPLNDGNLWIRWPTSTTADRWVGLLRQTEADAEGAGHLAIREVVELADSRRTMEKNTELFRELTADVLTAANIPFEPGSELDPEMIEEAADDIEFMLEEVDPETPAEELTEKQRVGRVWRQLRTVVDEDAAKIARASAHIRERVEGKLVFVGMTATGSAADFVQTPLDAKTPGVIVHAVVAHQAMTGQAIHFVPGRVSPILVVLLGLLCTLAGARFSAWVSAMLVGVMIAALIGAGLWLFASSDLLIPLVAPSTAGVSSWVACTALQAVISQQERNRVTRQFRARVSAQLVDHLAEHPGALSVSGEERELTVMFADLAGFTSISESLGGAKTVSTLNTYMSALTDILIEEDAYVNKFLGDGFMAFWSAFELDGDQAAKACRSALRCQDVVRDLNGTGDLTDVPDLGLRIGIATGHVVVGDCGAPPELNDYTVIGDAVNLAARLESANKQFGTQILVNGRTQELADGSSTLRPIGRVVVVGQSAPSEVFEILPADAPSEIVDATARAVAAFQEGRFDEASAAFDELAKVDDRTHVAKLYKEAMEEVPKDFDGVIRLQLK